MTHRAVAARADVPLSATTYWFSSRDELLQETLRFAAREEVERFERLVLDLATRELTVAEWAGALAAALAGELDAHRTRHLALFELALEAARRPALRPEAQQVRATHLRLAEMGARAQAPPTPGRRADHRRGRLRARCSTSSPRPGRTSSPRCCAPRWSAFSSASWPARRNRRSGSGHYCARMSSGLTRRGALAAAAVTLSSCGGGQEPPPGRGPGPARGWASSTRCSRSSTRRSAAYAALAERLGAGARSRAREIAEQEREHVRRLSASSRASAAPGHRPPAADYTPSFPRLRDADDGLLLARDLEQRLVARTWRRSRAAGGRRSGAPSPACHQRGRAPRVVNGLRGEPAPQAFVTGT